MKFKNGFYNFKGQPVKISMDLGVIDETGSSIYNVHHTMEPKVGKVPFKIIISQRLNSLKLGIINKDNNSALPEILNTTYTIYINNKVNKIKKYPMFNKILEIDRCAKYFLNETQLEEREDWINKIKLNKSVKEIFDLIILESNIERKMSLLLIAYDRIIKIHINLCRRADRRDGSFFSGREELYMKHFGYIEIGVIKPLDKVFKLLGHISKLDKIKNPISDTNHVRHIPLTFLVNQDGLSNTI